jgi:hypothetical protein
MGDNSFRNNASDPLLSGKELPTFKLSSWIAGNPVDVLATNFNKPESLICRFPRKDVFIAPNE